MNEPSQRNLILANALSRIVTLPTSKALYEALCETGITLFEADKAAVFRYSPSEEAIWSPKAIGLSNAFIQFLTQLFDNMTTVTLLGSKAAVVIDNVSTNPLLENYKEQFSVEGIHSIALFPMLVSEDSLGGLAIFYTQPKIFNKTELEVGSMLAKVCSATLQKIHLLDDAKIALERERKLNDINLLLSSSKDLPTILLSIVRLSTELVEADAGLLGVLIDPEMMTFYPYNIPPQIPLRPAARGRGVAWKIVQTGESILTHDYLSLENAQTKWGQLGIHSFLGVALKSGNDCLGCLTLFKLDPSTKFTERDLRTVEMIGRQAAITIENMRMFSEANHRANALANALTRQSELDKMKNQFIQTVSHELRSPLGIIFGHAELLESGTLGDLDDDQIESIRIITRRIRMLNDLVDDLTALLAAETQEFRRESINTKLLVTAVAADYKIRAKELGIDVQTEVEDELPWLNGDQTHLQRIFDNLFSNAFKFTPEGGTIQLNVGQQNGSVQFAFSDSGEGIDEEKLPRIFERFYQVKSKGKPRRFGTGLGLALVKEIVEAHRGTVTASSVLGQGTTFVITLPGFPPPIFD